jgi:hypothetical protein
MEADKKKRSEKEFHSCYMPVVNNAEGWSRISVEYDRPNFKVFVYDHTVQDFVHCFSMEITLDYQGYFLMSASAGDFNPYTTTVESFKLFDPKIFWKNTGELVKDRNAKGKKEGLGQIIAGRVSDLIHTRAEKTGEELSAMNSTHLMNQIAAQDYYIRPTLSKTEELLTKLQQHFA